jgi:hypothetical protein
VNIDLTTADQCYQLVALPLGAFRKSSLTRRDAAWRGVVEKRISEAVGRIEEWKSDCHAIASWHGPTRTSPGTNMEVLHVVGDR